LAPCEVIYLLLAVRADLDSNVLVILLVLQLIDDDLRADDDGLYIRGQSTIRHFSNERRQFCSLKRRWEPDG